jgi:cell division protein FtsB
MFDHALHRPTIPPVQCDVCFHWIERYYTDIPILQARIKMLTAQNESLRQENIDLKTHAERG